MRMSDEKKPSEKAIHQAAQCWQDDETQTIEMDIRLALAFAKRLDNNFHAIAELTERNIAMKAELDELKTRLAIARKALREYRE
jgi:hypothetical protein